MRPHVLDLRDPDASDAQLAGAKAANLAVATAAGLPTVPGFVVTTGAVEVGLGLPEVQAELRTAWERLGQDHDLVVRSSSTIEDAGSSSMAGRFTSVLGVRGWEGFVAALSRVVASAARVRDSTGEQRPIAVLVQRQLAAREGGVMFGVDPVTGDRRHVVVEVVPTGPDPLVGGTAVADHYVLSRRGRVARVTRADVAPRLGSRDRRALASMARRVERVFGSPQDVEWLIDPSGALWLLQSRPVTAIAADPARHAARHGVLLGPGPVAETFPDPLRPLEVDLWLDPLRRGIARALRTTGAVSIRVLDRSPVVTAVGGRAAVDLELLGLVAGQTSVRRRVNPVALVRRLGTAWRVGRLRVALPQLAQAIVETVDRDLSAIPRLDTLSLDELANLVPAVGTELTTVHTYEVLAGMLLERNTAPASGGSAAGRALDALADGRASGWDDRTIIERAPVVLVLVTPRLGGAPLPAGDQARPRRSTGPLPPREALRVRARWLQELGARIALEIGQKLVASGELSASCLLPYLHQSELVSMATGGPPPSDLAARSKVRSGPALPTSFRLAETGIVQPGGGERRGRRSAAAVGLPAGGGRGEGTVIHDPVEAVDAAERGAAVVLVTRHLEPELAPVLVHLAALVSETGSALSHLAILAREAGVPTVTGVEDALVRYPAGSALVVDGDTGDIQPFVQRKEVVS